MIIYGLVNDHLCIFLRFFDEPPGAPSLMIIYGEPYCPQPSRAGNLPALDAQARRCYLTSSLPRS